MRVEQDKYTEYYSPRWSLPGAGAWLLSLLLGIVPSVWPELLRPHPYAIFGLFLVGLALLLYPPLKAKSVQGESPGGSSIANVAGRDITGWQAGEVHGGVHYHSGQPEQSAPLPPKETASTKTEQKQKPKLLATCQSIGLSYDDRRGIWRAPSGLLTFVVWFENPIPDEGEQGHTYGSLVAHLKFTDTGSVDKVIQRAYWLESAGNEMRLEIGRRAAVIVGTWASRHVIAFENQHARSPFENHFAHPSQAHGPQFVVGANVPPLQVEISLISTNTGRIVARRKFELFDIAGKRTGVPLES